MTMHLPPRRAAIGTVLLILGVGLQSSGCSSASYKKQEYAQLQNAKDFEFEYPQVWRGAIDALGEYKIEDKDQEAGHIKTDWVYSTSNEKFVEYRVNGLPRRRHLQNRYKFDVKIEKQVGSVRVTVDMDEEVEKLKSDGSFDTWKSSSDIDTGRANELLRNIELKILSKPNI
jgi:hypothetical protein